MNIVEIAKIIVLPFILGYLVPCILLEIKSRRERQERLKAAIGRVYSSFTVAQFFASWPKDENGIMIFPEKES